MESEAQALAEKAAAILSIVAMAAGDEVDSQVYAAAS